VLVTAPGFDAEGELAERLRRSGLEIHHAGPRGNRRPEEVVELAQGAIAAIASSDPFTEDVLEALPHLKVIARLGVGTDSIDLEAATRCGVVVTITPGLNAETCADHTLAMLLAVMRRVVEHDASVRRGEWNRGGALTPWDLHGKRVGVVGYGTIGRCVVRRLQGFGTEIKVFDPVVAPESPLACESVSDLLGWADVVTLHVPLTPDTRGLIGASQMAAMKADAILVNTSRGGLVDESALVEALASGRLRGAALDVFSDEPPNNQTWRKLPNVVLSPHVGGLSHESIDAMANRCVQQVLDVLEGRLPDGVVNTGVRELAR
jgi:D-3-phosphoglycerate dehydrogenase